MSFFRHREIYRSDVSRVGFGNGAITAPGLIVSMSFQLVIPWRVALQHCPPPLRQLTLILQYGPIVALELFSQRRTVS